MLWVESLVAFGIWVLYASTRAKWLRAARRQYATKSRKWRLLVMLSALIGSLSALFCGVWLTAFAGWVRPDGMSIAGFLSITVVGLGFVHLQMVATALTLSLALDNETTPIRRRQIYDEPESKLGDKQ